jgi:trimeric autotransporter adhesin
VSTAADTAESDAVEADAAIGGSGSKQLKRKKKKKKQQSVPATGSSSTADAQALSLHRQQQQQQQQLAQVTAIAELLCSTKQQDVSVAAPQLNNAATDSSVAEVPSAALQRRYIDATPASGISAAVASVGDAVNDVADSSVDCNVVVAHVVRATASTAVELFDRDTAAQAAPTAAAPAVELSTQQVVQQQQGDSQSALAAGTSADQHSAMLPLQGDAVLSNAIRDVCDVAMQQRDGVTQTASGINEASAFAAVGGSACSLAVAAHSVESTTVVSTGSSAATTAAVAAAAVVEAAVVAAAAAQAEPTAAAAQAGTANTCCCSHNSASNSSSSSDSSSDRVITQLLRYQSQKVAAALQQVRDAAEVAAAAAAAANEATNSVAALGAGADAETLAAAIAAATAATATVLTAFNAQAAALTKLHSEQQTLQAQQSIVCSGSSSSFVKLDDSVYESDDDDCPPLAHASSAAISSELLQSDVRHDTTPGARVRAQAADASSSSSGCSLSGSGSAELSTQQQQQQSKHLLQQQPCAQCGKLTKKRCRRCQVVYYCSEQCQMLSFKDPEHRAQCEAAAAAAAPVATHL